jgi:FAD synthase
MADTDILDTIKQRKDQIKALEDQIEKDRQKLETPKPDWNKDKNKDTTKLKSNCIQKIKGDFKINNEISISDMVETFFNAIIKNIDNEDYVKEIMIAKNKLKIITDKII